MQCEIVAFDKEKATLTTKKPVLQEWLNPYSTMQGGMIIAAMDNVTCGHLIFCSAVYVCPFFYSQFISIILIILTFLKINLTELVS